MDDDLWYFRVGGVLGILPAIAAFIGGWWYCADTYGFLFGFGLGWLPAFILAVIVELAFMLLWGPALAAVAYFVVLPELRGDDTDAEASAIASSSSGTNELALVENTDSRQNFETEAEEAGQIDYSQMSDEELLQRIEHYEKSKQIDYSKMSDEELLRLYAEECGEPNSSEMTFQELREIAAVCAAEKDIDAAVNDAVAATSDAIEPVAER